MWCAHANPRIHQSCIQISKSYRPHVYISVKLILIDDICTNITRNMIHLQLWLTFHGNFSHTIVFLIKSGYVFVKNKFISPTRKMWKWLFHYWPPNTLHIVVFHRNETRQRMFGTDSIILAFVTRWKTLPTWRYFHIFPLHSHQPRDNYCTTCKYNSITSRLILHF